MFIKGKLIVLFISCGFKYASFGPVIWAGYEDSQDQ